MPIGKITDVQRLSTQHVTDDQHNKDIKYKRPTYREDFKR